MATWRVNNSTALGGEICSPWQANHAYGLGARCVCTVAGGQATARAFVYEVTSAGTSHSTTQPTWPTTVGNTVVDNGVTWTCRSPSDGSWDNASCFLHYILNHASPAAGDTVLIDDGHAEVTAMETTYTIKGTTINNPIKIICVDKATDALSTGASIAPATGSMYFTLGGYSYGVKYKGTAYNSALTFIGTTAGAWVLEGNNTDVLEIAAQDADINIQSTSGSSVSLKIIKGNIVFGHATQTIKLNYSHSFEWAGGSLSGTAPTALFNNNSSAPQVIRIRDVDLSALGNNDLYYLGAATSPTVILTRCKIPATFDVIGGTSWTVPRQGKVILHHCSSENKTYDFKEVSYEGTCEDEATVVRTGGASDGTTTQAIKMASTANTLEQINPLESPPINGWTDSTSEKTFTIEFVHDSATALQNDEIWMELEYPANNSDGLGAIATSRCAILGSPADTTDSSETWTTTGLTNPNTRKLSVTCTPGKAGPITARVYLGKASTTVYVDPVITES